MYILVGQLFSFGKPKQIAVACNFKTLAQAKEMQARYELTNWFKLQIIRL